MSAFIDYITGAELIMHNAPFDVGFLNHEFKLANSNHLTSSQDINSPSSRGQAAGSRVKKLEKYAKVFDTLALARKKHPGKKNSSSRN